MNVEKFAHIVGGIYASDDNEVRKRDTLELIQLEEQMTAEEIRGIGIGLLEVTDGGAAVQAYGAVLLRNAILSNRISPSDVPYGDLMAWYFCEPTLSRLLCANLVELLAECMVREWPESCPDLVSHVCSPSGQLAGQPRKLHFLSSFLARATASRHGSVPVNRVRPLRKAVEDHSRTILVEVINALSVLYSCSGGAASSDCAAGNEQSLADCLSIVVSTAPYLSLSVWSEVGVANALGVLVQWRPAAQEALATTTALLRCERLSAAPGAEGSELVNSIRTELLNIVLGSVGMWANEPNCGNIREVMGLLNELPDAVLWALAPLVGRVCLIVLSVRDIFLASAACSVLCRLRDVALAEIDPSELLTRLSSLIPKSTLHSTCGTFQEEGKSLEPGYGTADAYMQAFGEFRSLSAKVLTSVAEACPIASNQFMLQLISNLCDSRGTKDDMRTHSGFVTRQSYTFCCWEATEFILSSLSGSFRYTSEYVPQIIEEFVKRQPEDMVVYPVYMNMISLLWNCRDDAALGVWQGTMDIILTPLEGRFKELNDIDVVSARKRALTLLLTACSQHAVRLLALGDSFSCQLERLLMLSASPMERTLLYEAIAAFTTVLPDDQAQQRLQAFLDPMAKIIVDNVAKMSQGDFIDIIVGRTGPQKSQGYTIRDSINVFAGALRRCKTLPYVVEVALSLAPSVMKLMEFTHNFGARDLPSGYESLVSSCDGGGGTLPRSDLHGRRGGGGGNPKADVHRARKILSDIRLALYQVIGALSSVFPVEPLENMLHTLSMVVRSLPVSSMRQLLSRCLFPAASNYERLIPAVLPLCSAFYTQRSGNTPRSPEAETVEASQLYGLSKDIFGFIKQNIVDLKRHHGNPVLWQAVVDVTLSILECGVNVSESSRFISTIVSSGSRNKTFPGAESGQVDGIAQYAYGRMVDFAVGADENLLPPKEREKLFTSLADSYVFLYPLYVGTLKERYPQPEVDCLNTSLTMVSRTDAKRMCFKEFLQRFGGPCPTDCDTAGGR